MTPIENLVFCPNPLTICPNNVYIVSEKNNIQKDKDMAILTLTTHKIANIIGNKITDEAVT